MKTATILFTGALVGVLLLSGCRSKGNDNLTPSTTTVPTLPPSTMAPTESIETTAATDPTIPSGNGPIEDTTPGTASTDDDSTTGTTEASRSRRR